MLVDKLKRPSEGRQLGPCPQGGLRGVAASAGTRQARTPTIASPGGAPVTGPPKGSGAPRGDLWSQVSSAAGGTRGLRPPFLQSPTAQRARVSQSLPLVPTGGAREQPRGASRPSRLHWLLPCPAQTLFYLVAQGLMEAGRPTIKVTFWQKKK